MKYILLLLAAAFFTDGAFAADKAAMPNPLDAIRERALQNNWAYDRLADLTDKIGPRLSGSVGAQAAVDQVAAVMKAQGFKVTLQPVKVKHWVRGAESAELVDYPGRPHDITQHLHLTTLGGSVATPDEGIVAPVLVVKSFAELTARASEAKDRIVLFDAPFDQTLAENGQAGHAYQAAGLYRRTGASAAARVGAVAALVRSVGGADYRLPHTGQMSYAEDTAKIPTAALSAEDSALIDRLAKQGAVKMKLVLTPQSLPEVESFNVIGDWVGSEKPDEFVMISGHLDSWDLATGAIDDGAGVAAAVGAAHVIKDLNLHPKRTIRVVAWMSEENGGAGGTEYFNANQDQVQHYAAVIESDNGAGKPLGIQINAKPESLKQLQPVADALQSIGATVMELRTDSVGSDISEFQTAGVPGFEPLLDMRHYFDYHHTAADTLDKVDPKNLQRLVATMAVLAYHLADMPEMLARTKN